MLDSQTSCTLIMTQISVSFTGDFRLDLTRVGHCLGHDPHETSTR